MSGVTCRVVTHVLKRHMTHSCVLLLFATFQEWFHVWSYTLRFGFKDLGSGLQIAVYRIDLCTHTIEAIEDRRPKTEILNTLRFGFKDLGFRIQVAVYRIDLSTHTRGEKEVTRE